MLLQGIECVGNNRMSFKQWVGLIEIHIQIKHKWTKTFTGVQLGPTVLPCGIHGKLPHGPHEPQSKIVYADQTHYGIFFAQKHYGIKYGDKYTKSRTDRRCITVCVFGITVSSSNWWGHWYGPILSQQWESRRCWYNIVSTLFIYLNVKHTYK